MLLATIIAIALVIFALMLIGSGVVIIAVFGDVIIWGLIVALLIVLIKKLINH